MGVNIELNPGAKSLKVEGTEAICLPQTDWSLITFILIDRQTRSPGKFVLWDHITRVTSGRDAKGVVPTKLNKVFASLNILKREEILYRSKNGSVEPGVYVGGSDQRPRYFVHNVSAAVKETNTAPTVLPLRLIDRIRLVRKPPPTLVRQRGSVDAIKWGGDPLPMKPKAEANHLPSNLIPPNLWPGLLLEVVSVVMIQGTPKNVDYYTLLHRKFHKKIEEWTGVCDGSAEFNTRFVEACITEWNGILHKAEEGKPLSPMERRIVSMFKSSSD